MKNECYIQQNKSEASMKFNGGSTRAISGQAFRPISGKSCVSQKLPNLTTHGMNKSNLYSPDQSSTCSIKELGHIIETEKLQEETMRYRIIINELQKELNIIKAENKEKDYNLFNKENEIKRILHKLEAPDNLETDGKNLRLFAKMRHEYKLVEKDLDEELLINAYLKKNIKLTKMNEYSIESTILQSQIDQITSLINNCLITKEIKQKEISQFHDYEVNLPNQNLIIDSLKSKYANQLNKEANIIKDIEKYKEQLFKDNEMINTYTQDNITLMKQNEQLLKEKNQIFQNKKVSKIKEESFDNSSAYLKRIEELEKQVSLFRSEANKSEQLVNKLQAMKNNYIKLRGNQTPITLNHNTNIDKSIVLSKNTVLQEDDIIKLRMILEHSKKIEEDLNYKVAYYEERIKNYDNIDNNEFEFNIKSDNPFYTNEPTNEPIISQKFTPEQFNQFIYVLFKNFEAKHISQEIFKDKLLSSLITHSDAEQDSIKELMTKFGEKVSDLLDCQNSNDKIKLEILFGALCYNSNNDFEKLTNYLLSIIAYIQVYSEEKKEKLKKRIHVKYYDSFISLKEKIMELQLPEDYISLIQLKQVIDDNSLIIKDKYVEFLFYSMKQFTNKQVALEDLKISLLYELVEGCFFKEQSQVKEPVKEQGLLQKRIQDQSSPNNNKEKEVDQSDEVHELSVVNFEELIKNAIGKMKEFLNTNNMSLRDLLSENLILLDDPPQIEAITLEDLFNVLSEKEINLSDLQLSCLLTKYSVNNSRALSFAQLEMDIESLNKMI